jgi:hypothetical protein
MADAASTSGRMFCVNSSSVWGIIVDNDLPLKFSWKSPQKYVARNLVWFSILSISLVWESGPYSLLGVGYSLLYICFVLRIYTQTICEQLLLLKE